MDNRFIYVPLSRLLDPRFTVSAKLIWMALLHHSKATPAELQAYTCLSRDSINRALHQPNLRSRVPKGPKAKVPIALLADRRVSPRAKVIYALLQACPTYNGHRGQFTYDSLSSITHISPNTLRTAMSVLVNAGWVKMSQANRLTPIHFTLGNPPLRRSQALAALARRRLKRATNYGEALMQEYLSLLIDSDDWTDTTRPGFLSNPLTGELLEFDRYYLTGVAFEFQGSQHYQASGEFSQEEVKAQQLRDLIKGGLCLQRGIRLITIDADDLSLQRMIEKIGDAMPLRNLAGQEPLIDLLETESLVYVASAKNPKPKRSGLVARQPHPP